MPAMGEDCPSCFLNIQNETESPPVPIDQQMKMYKRGLVIPELSDEEIRAVPGTISRKRLPLDTLSRANTSLRGVVQGLRQVYTSWRSSSIDGNSFYRCLGVAWLERIVRTNMPLVIKKKWTERLKGRKAYFTATAETAEYFYIVIKALNALVETWDDRTAMNRLIAIEQEIQFDEALCIFIRTVTANYSKLQSATQAEKQAIMSLGEEPPNEKTMKWAADAFRLQLQVYKSGDKVAEVTAANVAMVRIGPRFALLYSVTQDFFDGYSYETCDCKPPTSENSQQFCCSFS
jgi:hypothetical protein